MKRVYALLTGVTVVLVSFLGFSAAASAHTTLVSGDPAPNSKIESAPATITLSFTNDLLGGPASNIVVLTDTSGKSYVTGTTSITGATLTVADTIGDTPGIYTLAFRVVASDGHPIESSYTFTVGTPTAAQEAKASAAAKDSSNPDNTNQADALKISINGWALASGVAVALVVLATIIMTIIIIVHRQKMVKMGAKKPSARK